MKKTMKKTLLLCILVLCLALGLSACRTARVQDVVNAPVPYTAQTQDKLTKVEQAIKTAGAKLGWNMVSTGPNTIVGTIWVRNKHMAEVEIPYTAESYSILYKDSRNLKYDGTKIHSNYNAWVSNLDREIKKELAAEIAK